MTTRPLFVRALVLGLLLGVSPAAHAQDVTITLGSQAAQVASRLGLTTAQLKTLVKGQVSALYGLVNVQDFLRLSANAAGLANQGLAVDYTTPFDRLIFGVGVNAAVATGQSDLGSVVGVMGSAAAGDLQRAVPVGAGAQVSLLAGVRVADGLVVFANGLAYPISIGTFSGSGYNLGAHVQYRLGEGLGASRLLAWGGLALTTGLELSRAELHLADTLDAPAALAADLDVLTSSKGTITLTQQALTVPLELTTSVHLLSVLTLFGGVGADLQLGSAGVNLNVTSTLTGVAASGQRYALGTAQATYAGEHGADALLLRVLGGVELDLGPVHLYTQASLLTADLSLGLAAGLRVGI